MDNAPAKWGIEQKIPSADSYFLAEMQVLNLAADLRSILPSLTTNYIYTQTSSLQPMTAPDRWQFTKSQQKSSNSLCPPRGRSKRSNWYWYCAFCNIFPSNVYFCDCRLVVVPFVSLLSYFRHYCHSVLNSTFAMKISISMIRMWTKMIRMTMNYEHWSDWKRHLLKALRLSVATINCCCPTIAYHYFLKNARNNIAGLPKNALLI